MVGFLFPPHPDSSMRIRPDSLPQLEKQGGWLAQRKYNGSHVVAHFHNGKLSLWNRHGDPFTTYKQTLDMQDCFASMKGIRQEVVFDGELLHTKAKSKITGSQAATNTIVLFDLLYYGKHLLTESFEQRYNRLLDICGTPTLLETTKRALVVRQIGGSQLWLAETFTNDFLYRFYELYDFDDQERDQYPEIEGLVCKRAKSSFLRQGSKKYDVSWMMRVRKTKEKVYLF